MVVSNMGKGMHAYIYEQQNARIIAFYRSIFYHWLRDRQLYCGRCDWRSMHAIIIVHEQLSWNMFAEQLRYTNQRYKMRWSHTLHKDMWQMYTCIQVEQVCTTPHTPIHKIWSCPVCNYGKRVCASAVIIIKCIHNCTRVHAQQRIKNFPLHG